TGAIARWDVQATAEGDCKMRVVAANTAAFLICFERRSSGPRVLIAEHYVIMHEVADSLHSWPTKRGASEEPPSLVGQSIGLAVTTTKQKQYDFCRQVLNLMLQSVQVDRVRHARVTNNGVGAEAEMTTGHNEAAAKT